MKAFALLTGIFALGRVPIVNAHEHMPAAATSSDPGATLIYAPGATDYRTNSGYVFALNAGDPDSPYNGFFYTDDQVFTALAATPDLGGPQPNHAAVGTFIQVKLLGVTGPAGAHFGFWETAEDGVDATSLTWSVPVPFANGTNLIFVSQSDGSPGSDPYGHLHGRIYSVDKPGFYTAIWQWIDTSTNGVNGGPVDLPSAPFATYYQAGLTIRNLTKTSTNCLVTFAAPSDLPDDLSTPPTQYTLEASPALGINANWQPVGSQVTGDDQLHTLAAPLNGTHQYFRLNALYFNTGGDDED